MSDMTADKPLTFAISLSVLDHLGRNLYRSFATVLGEAISNSWDADADDVWIYIDREKGSFFIKDNGDGMDRHDFQNKFLKIGYSKRKDGKSESPKGRPYIGRKGIGKLALLSCADRIHVISKKEGGGYVGGIIDNSGLDKAIKSDLTPDEYPLEPVDMKIFEKLVEGHRKGTIIYFENMKDGIRNTLDYLRKLIALYFRFSLVDESFKIHLDDKMITLDDLKELADATEFLWVINDLEDPYIKKSLKFSKKNKKNDANLVEPPKAIKMKGVVRGFIASVRTPKELKIMGTDEKIGVDLFVNGRLREKNILAHIPSARIPESYLYGQIHFDSLNDEEDRFSTSREAVVPDDKMFSSLLEDLQDVLKIVFNDWDEWRSNHRKTGDEDNPRITKKERKAEELYNEVSKEYEIKEDPKHPGKKEKVDKWVDELMVDARFNIPSYAECFISENLVRKHIKEKKIKLTKPAVGEVKTMKKKEAANRNRGNVNIPIRRTPVDTSYLSMDTLAYVVDKGKDPLKEACLTRDANEYKPIRDAVAHTALLTEPAKNKLTTVFVNIKERVRNLLATT